MAYLTIYLSLAPGHLHMIPQIHLIKCLYIIKCFSFEQEVCAHGTKSKASGANLTLIPHTCSPRSPQQVL